MQTARLRKNLASSVLAAAAVGATAQRASAPRASATPTFGPQLGVAGKDVIWLPTNQVLVDRMLGKAHSGGPPRRPGLGRRADAGS